MNTIYTAGYQAWTLHALAEVAQAKNAIIVDIRYSPTSMRAEWKREALRARFGLHYQHLPSLGNRNYQGGPIVLANPGAAITPIAQLLESHSVILLCACRDIQMCHRKHAAEFLSEQLGAPFEHLEPPVTVKAGYIKAITLTQPYATLVAYGLKRVETRSWATTYRGPLAIHAASTYNGVGGKRAFLELCTANEFIYRALHEAGLVPFTWDTEALLSLPRSAVLAVTNLDNCWTTAGHRSEHGPKYSTWVHELSAQERAFGDYTPGRYGWLLSTIQRLPEPIPAKGAMGLWDWQPPEVKA